MDEGKKVVSIRKKQQQELQELLDELKQHFERTTKMVADRELSRPVAQELVQENRRILREMDRLSGELFDWAEHDREEN